MLHDTNPEIAKYSDLRSVGNVQTSNNANSAVGRDDKAADSTCQLEVRESTSKSPRPTTIPWFTISLLGTRLRHEYSAGRLWFSTK